MTILIFVMRTLWLACVTVALALPARPQPALRKSDWPAYGRDPGGTRYSPLDQINTTNVKRLQRAWVYHTGEPGRAFEVHSHRGGRRPVLRHAKSKDRGPGSGDRQRDLEVRSEIVRRARFAA